jgi:hypothetical protein
MPVFLCIALLTGCGVLRVASKNPYGDSLAAITPGQTSREQVHSLLGTPTWVSDNGRAEVYEARGSGIGSIAIVVPVPASFPYFAMVIYDDSGRASATGWTVSLDDYASSRWGDVTIYADGYGLYWASRTLFPSVDAGGKVDEAWSLYLRFLAYSLHTGKYSDLLPRYLCNAVIHGHPCASIEVGNYFWDGPTIISREKIVECYPQDAQMAWQHIHKDNTKACVWYSIANNNVLPPWCSDELSQKQVAEVDLRLKEMLMNWHPEQWKWYPNQCTNELESYR